MTSDIWHLTLDTWWKVHTWLPCVFVFLQKSLVKIQLYLCLNFQVIVNLWYILAQMLQSYKWMNGLGWVELDGNLFAGWFIEHHFTMLINRVSRTFWKISQILCLMMRCFSDVLKKEKKTWTLIFWRCMKNPKHRINNVSNDGVGHHPPLRGWGGTRL